MRLIIADANIIEELSELLTQKILLFAYPPLNMSRVRMSHELKRVRHVSSRNRQRRFTTLLHHVYRLDTLR
jgi:hypothetical protein